MLFVLFASHCVKYGSCVESLGSLQRGVVCGAGSSLSPNSLSREHAAKSVGIVELVAGEIARGIVIHAASRSQGAPHITQIALVVKRHLT
jgi:hypothetical protein